MRQRRLFVIVTALFLSLLAFIGAATMFQPLAFPTAPIADAAPAVPAVPAAQAAFAHAFVIGSDPVDGSTINKVPAAVHIFFNAAISPLSSAHIYAIQNGNLVEISAAAASVAPSNLRELVLSIRTPGTQPQGSYEVIWTAVANDDGHTTFGIIGFNVGFSGLGLSGTPLLGPTSSNKLAEIRSFTTTGLLSIGWDWLVLIALTLWLGILIMERLVLPTTEYGTELLARIRKQTSSLEWTYLTALILGEIVLLILRSIRLAGADGSDFTPASLLSFVTQTNYGLLWIIRMLLLLTVAGLLYWTGQRQDLKKVALVAEPAQRKTITQDVPASQTSTARTTKKETKDTKDTVEIEEAMPLLQPQSYTPLLLMLVGLIVLTQALSSNVSQVLQPPISAVIFEWLALISQGIWFGSLGYLGYALLPQLPGTELDHNAETLVVILRRVTPLVLAGLGIFLVSTLFLSEASIDNAPQWLADPYGMTLVIQLLIITLICLLSLYTFFLLRRKITRQVLFLPVVNAELPARRTRQSVLGQTRRHLKQMINLQLWLSIAVLLCTALLSFFAPPIVFPAISYSNPPVTQANSSANVQTKQLGNLTVTLLVTPGRTGQANTVIITLNDSSGKAVNDAQLQVSTNMQVMDMGTGHASIKGGNTVYSATFDQRSALNMAGLWTITIEIQRPHQPPLTGTFQVMLS